MKTYLFIALLALNSFCLFVQSDNPSFKKSAAAIKDFVPVGWKIIYKAKGDLNKDRIPDEVLIIENTNPKNLIKNDGMGGDTLNINPRILLVLFKESNGSYRLIAKNSKFIPAQNDAESPCLTDPLSETGAIKIEKGVFVLSYQYWMSCGSYGVTNVDYTFRFQNQKFDLIGFDSKGFSRSSGEESDTSINFSTHRIGETTGGNMFEEKDNKPKTKWRRFPWSKMINLETITEADADKIQSL